MGLCSIRAQEELQALRGARQWEETWQARRWGGTWQARRWGWERSARRLPGKTWRTSPRPASSGITLFNQQICKFVLIFPRSPNTGHHRLPPYHPPPPPHRKTNGGAGLVFEVDPNHILLCTAVISLGFEQTFALNNSQYDSIAEPSGRPSYL